MEMSRAELPEEVSVMIITASAAVAAATTACAIDSFVSSVWPIAVFRSIVSLSATRCSHE